MLEEERREVKKILVVRYRFIGDTVLLTPFLKNLKENFPNAKIDVIVSPNSGELIEGNPAVHRVIYLDTTKFHKYEVGKIKRETRQETYYSLIGCAMALRKEKYEISFVLKRSFSSALLSFFIGARERIGFNSECRSFLLTKPVKYEKKKKELENFLDCLKVLNIKPKQYIPEIFPTNEEKQKAEEIIGKLDRKKPKVLIHATSAHPYKQWTKTNLGALLDLLYEEREAQFIFTGAYIDKEFYTKLLTFSKHSGRFKFLNLCGLVSLRECYALYEKVDFAICMDSGNAHIASAAGIPTFVIYGPTNPEKWLPNGKNVFPIRLNQLLSCQPCNVKIKCDHLSCMKLLTPDFVFQQVKSFTPQFQKI